MQELNEIARRHPESVAFVFNQYGYGHIPVTGVSIHAMSVKFGHEFLQDLAAHIAKESEYSGFSFSNMLQNLTAPVKPKQPTAPSVAKRNGIRRATGDVDYWEQDLEKKQVRFGLVAGNERQPVKLPAITPLPGPVKRTVAGIPIMNPGNDQKKPFFDTVLGILERGAGIVGSVRNNQIQQQMEQQKSRRTNNTALIVGISLVAALLVGLLLFKNKKVIK
jgi:hypothetical protein